MKTTISRKDFQRLLADYGHHANVTVPVHEHELEEEVWRTVLNNGMVYNPYGQKQFGMSNNKTNAKNAMRFIKNEAMIYSSVFSQASGHYQIN